MIMCSTVKVVIIYPVRVYNDENDDGSSFIIYMHGTL
jgi:hypothetical protein